MSYTAALESRTSVQAALAMVLSGNTSSYRISNDQDHTQSASSSSANSVQLVTAILNENNCKCNMRRRTQHVHSDHY
eukprot:6628-Heterococcus_DN1.PRE.1